MLKKQIAFLALAGATASIKAMSPAAIALISQMIPDNISTSLTFGINQQIMNQTCYGNINNSVYNDSGKVTIVQGTCANTGGQQVNSLGKAGMAVFIPTDKIHNIRRLGAIGANPKVIDFEGPKANNQWDTALLFTFLPENPDSGTNPRGIVGPVPLYKGRTIEVIIRSQKLTSALAQAEGYTYAKYPNHILLEVWARMNPSITGATNFKQIFNKPLPASAEGKEAFAFYADQSGKVAIAYKVAEADEPPVIFAHEFNAIEETANIK